MHPIICTIGPFHIYAYGLMLVLAFIVGNSLAVAEAKRRKIDPDAIFNFIFAAFVCGIIGSRLFYVIEHISYYAKNPLEIIMLQRGGMSWFGGLMLGITAGIIYLKRKKLPIYQTLDLVAPYLVLGQSIGRIGCLLNGCCFGKTPFLPTQVYSSLALLLIFIILRLMQNEAPPGVPQGGILERPSSIFALKDKVLWPRKYKLRPAGEIFSAYLLLYAIKRFTVEFWRLDNAAVFHGLTLFQVLSVIMFILGASRFIFLKLARPGKKH